MCSAKSSVSLQNHLHEAASPTMLVAFSPCPFHLPSPFSMVLPSSRSPSTMDSPKTDRSVRNNSDIPRADQRMKIKHGKNPDMRGYLAMTSIHHRARLLNPSPPKHRPRNNGDGLFPFNYVEYFRYLSDLTRLPVPDIRTTTNLLPI